MGLIKGLSSQPSIHPEALFKGGENALNIMEVSYDKKKKE